MSLPWWGWALWIHLARTWEARLQFAAAQSFFNNKFTQRIYPDHKEVIFNIHRGKNRYFMEREHDFSSAHRNQKKSDCHKFVLQVATSFDDSLKREDGNDPVQRKYHNDALTNSSTQIIQALIKILFAQNDTPTPQMASTKKEP